MTTSLRIGNNASFHCGVDTLLKTRLFDCHGNAFLFGTVRTVVVHSSGVIDGTGTIYHSFSRTGEESISTITPDVMQINIDRDIDFSGLYYRSFENGMITIFDIWGPTAVFAMGVPFILLEPKAGP